MSTIKQFYGRNHDLVDPYGVVVFKLIFNLMISAEA